MTRLRAERVERIAESVPDLEVDDPDGAELLVLGWGSSYGAIEGAARRVRRENGVSVATAHLRHLNPLPAQHRRRAARYPRVLVPEMNMGQLAMVLRARFLVDCESYTKVDGLPIFTRDVMDQIIERPGMSENGSALPVLTKTDFSSDQETRWCPGCGDYAILASVQGLLPELGIPPEKTVFVTGIGCAGRFVYYMDTYGMHGIHGRAPALATGVATSRPDLSVWVVSGDGDALSIGGNHLIHALRRNVPLKILLFNNQIYGLTKGQYSPTSEEGKVTKSTPFGSQDHPFNPVALALGAEATFVARTVDTDKAHVAATLRAAAQHRGAALVEIYQNCNVFNDGAFDAVRVKGRREVNQIRLEHGQPDPLRRRGRERGVVRGAGRRACARRGVADVDESRDRRPRRPPRGPRPCVRARPPCAAAHRPNPGWRLPRHRAPGLRRGLRAPSWRTTAPMRAWRSSSSSSTAAAPGPSPRPR